jgi:hypothetical protein
LSTGFIFCFGSETSLLISVPGASLSAWENYEKAQVPAFSRTNSPLKNYEKAQVLLGAGAEPPRRFAPAGYK